MLTRKKHYLQALYRKTDKSQLNVINVRKGLVKLSKNIVKNNNIYTTITDAFKHIYPEKDGIYTGISLKFLTNSDFLMLVYNFIKNEKRNLTFENNNNTVINSLFRGYFQKIASDIKQGIYEFKFNCKTNINAKKKNCRIKPVKFNNLKDKIIKKAIQLILEEIYERREKNFSKFSHGFHLKKNNHTAFKQIKNE
jgi:hypothetical protein